MTRGPALPEKLDTHCGHCGALLVRKICPDGFLERSGSWLKRQFCNSGCRNAGRPKREPHASVDAIQWAPIVATPSADDQCWAGFVAGRRCVLERGGHVTHRDADGKEFVGIQRRPMPLVERSAKTFGVEEWSSMWSEIHRNYRESLAKSENR